ncbi:MAG: chemotaxis protein CheW [Thioalkalispiraceae bacterium]|jgi:chemotaxis-related protein WspD
MSEVVTDSESGIEDCWNTIGVWSVLSTRCPKLAEVIHCRNCDVYSRAGRSMLERRLPAGYEETWAALYREDKKKQLAGTESVTIFRLGNEWMALPTQSIQEVTEVCSVHSIPHRQTPVLRGLVNIRGQLKICLSLGQLMGIEKSESYSGKDSKERIYERMITIKHNDGQYVFLVSEVKGTYRYHQSELQPPPSTLSHAKGTFTRGILQWEDHEVACLDAELMFYSLEKQMR